jgi:hypothetical protein
VAEFVPGYDATGWYGVGAPKSTPADIVDKLNREVNAGLADPTIKARLAVRPSARDAPSPAAALVPDFQGATQCALWISSKNFCRGLTAPDGGIRSASSIGTIVRSSAVVVGQRFERGVP